MAGGKPAASPISLSDRQGKLLYQLASQQKIIYREKIRCQIIVLSSEGISMSQICRDLAISITCVRRWRRRWISGREELMTFELGHNGQVPKDHELLARIRDLLSDAPRSGTPPQISQSQKQQILALACEQPQKYGIVMSQWNREMLAKVAIAQRIVKTVSPRYISDILKKTN